MRLTNDIERELRELQAHLSKLDLGLRSQYMTAMSPKAGHRLTNRLVLCATGSIYVSGVCNLALSRALDAVHLAVSQLLELVHTHLAGENVDTSVLEELLAGGVGVRESWIRDQLEVLAAVWDLLWEVLVGVEVLEEAGDGVEWVVWELDDTGLLVLERVYSSKLK